MFSVAKPMSGLSDIHISTLTQAIHIEAQKHKGSEMVFQVNSFRPTSAKSLILAQIVTFAQEWILDHVTPIVEAYGSLATEMNQRASEEQRVRLLYIYPCGKFPDFAST
jgi:translation initiation factor 2-alpha kinase 4